MSQIKLRYHFEIRDTKTGKLIKKTRKRLCRSFLINFMKSLELFMGHIYDQDSYIVYMVDTGGTERSIFGSQSYGDRFFVACALSGDSQVGIVVGTGATAVTTSDNALDTQIAHGGGSGQLNYGASSCNGAVDSGVGCTMTFTRDFGNASGDTITIREIGIVVRHSGYYCLISRDIVTQAVANGNTATAVIEISTEL